MNTEVESDDFGIAKAVFDKLKDLSAERQKRIIGWVSESLNIKSPPPAVAPAPPASPPPTAPGTLPPGGAGIDIKSFVAAKAPKSDSQFATTVAYYYRFDAPPPQRRDSINAEVLQEAARLAGRARFANPLKTLNNSKGLGYLDSAGRGEFSVNSVGENLVAMTLPGGAEAGKAAASRRRNPSKKTPRR